MCATRSGPLSTLIPKTRTMAALRILLLVSFALAAPAPSIYDGAGSQNNGVTPYVHLGGQVGYEWRGAPGWFSRERDEK
jgi:hypothetical protein